MGRIRYRPVGPGGEPRVGHGIDEFRCELHVPGALVGDDVEIERGAPAVPGEVRKLLDQARVVAAGVASGLIVSPSPCCPKWPSASRSGSMISR